MLVYHRTLASSSNDDASLVATASNRTCPSATLPDLSSTHSHRSRTANVSYSCRPRYWAASTAASNAAVASAMLPCLANTRPRHRWASTWCQTETIHKNKSIGVNGQKRQRERRGVYKSVTYPAGYHLVADPNQESFQYTSAPDPACQKHARSQPRPASRQWMSASHSPVDLLAKQRCVYRRA
jgi:hypothetical protein